MMTKILTQEELQPFHCIIRQMLQRCGNTLERGQPSISRSTMNSIFDAEMFRLGGLCLRGHDWNGAGQSLRYRANGNCRDCQLAWDRKASYQRNRDKFLAQGKSYREKNREIVQKKDRERYLKRRDRARAYYRNYYQQNRTQIRARHKIYNNSDAGKFANRTKRCRRRAKIQLAHHFQYTADQVLSLREKFNFLCAYCDATDAKELDHFLAITKGGSDCLGNIVPACKSCNSSKCNADPLLWYSHQTFYSKKRWQKILKVLGKTKSNYNQIPLF